MSEGAIERAELMRRLGQGAASWAAWRGGRPPGERVNFMGQDLRSVRLVDYDLRNADLQGAQMTGADMRYVRLAGADLYETDIRWARLYKADLTGATLGKVQGQGADFRKAQMRGVDLENAHLRDATFREADMREAKLRTVDLTNAVFVQTDLRGAQLIGCRVYGCAAWRPNLAGATQHGLVVTALGESDILVDDLEIAQFLHLLIDNRKIRNVLDTVASSAVLLLGRFYPKRKRVLDAIAAALRAEGYVPILFDFEPSARRDLTETISILAGLVKFVVVDLTDAKSVPQELSQIVPRLPSVAVLPILANGHEAYSMFPHWQRFQNVGQTRSYDEVNFDAAALTQELIAAAAETDHQGALRAELSREQAARVAANETIGRLEAELKRLRAAHPDRGT